MNEKPTRWDYLTTGFVLILFVAWVIYDLHEAPDKIPFEPIISVAVYGITLWGYSRWKNASADSKSDHKSEGQIADKIYNIGKIKSAKFSVFINGGSQVALVALLAIAIWQKDEIKELFGFNRFFRAKDEDFKILILPFKQICAQGGQNYDAGFVVTERLNDIIAKEHLKIKTHYWEDYDFKNFNDQTVKALREYHNADMILFGAYQTDACSGDGDQVCINYITDEKWNIGSQGTNLRRDYQKGGVDELREGKLQEKIENLATLISLIAQVKSIDHEGYLKKLREALNEEDLNHTSQAAIYIEIADKLREEGKLEEILVQYDKALKIYLAANDEANIARCFQRIGRVYMLTGDLKKALTYFEKYNQLEKDMYSANPTSLEYKNCLAISYQFLGATHSSLGDLERALTFFEKDMELSKELYVSYPTNAEFKNGLAVSYEKLGETHSSLDNLERALTFFEKDMELSKELYASYPTNAEFKNGLAISYSKLGETYRSLGNLKRALTFFEDETTLSKELYTSCPTNVSFKNGLAISYSKLGETYRSLGNLEQALTFFEDETKLSEELYTLYPTNVSFKNGLSVSYSKLGETYRSLGNLEQALTFFKKDTELSKELYTSYPTNVSFKNGLAISYEKLGETHSSLGNLEGALTFFEDETKLFEELYASYPTNVEFKNGLAISYEKLGSTHSSLGNLEGALTFFEERNKLGQELYTSYPTNVSFKNGLAISWYKLGEISLKKEDKTKAKAYFQQAEVLWQELVCDAPQFVQFQRFLGIVQEVLSKL